MDALTLSSTRLRLRPVGAGDVEALHRLWMDPQVRRFLWDDIVISRAQAEAVVAAGVADFAAHRFGLWAVFPRHTAELIGFSGVRSADGGASPELLYGLHPHWWGCGFATEAARAVLSYAFATLGCARITAATDAPNAASVRVLQRLGMRCVRRGRLNGLDTLFYTLQREDFLPATRTPEETA